jgi:hypothetical protein
MDFGVEAAFGGTVAGSEVDMPGDTKVPEIGQEGDDGFLADRVIFAPCPHGGIERRACRPDTVSVWPGIFRY